MHLKRLIGFVMPFILIVCANLSCTTAVQVAGNIEDDLYRTMNFQSIPERIVSVAPSNTEILFALGLGNKVVGVTNWCNYPDEVNDRCDQEEGTEGKLLRIGDAFGINMESVISLEPDVVFGFGYNVPTWATQLEDLGIPVVIFAPQDIEDVLNNVELTGKICGVEQKAKQLTTQMRAEFEVIVTKTAYVTPVSVFFETGYYNGIWTTGKNSFIGNLIRLAGGTDIGAAVPEGYPIISLEYIVDQDPDIIILGDAPWESKETVIARGGAWSGLSAVRDGKIYEIDADLISRNGPRIIEALKALVEIMHPEIDLQS